MANQTGGIPPFLKGLGFLVVGLILLGISAFRPMYQVTQGQREIFLSLKLVLCAAMLTVVGAVYTVLGDKGLPWKKTKEQPVTSFQKATIWASMAAALAIVGGVWLFFKQHGYEMHF